MVRYKLRSNDFVTKCYGFITKSFLTDTGNNVVSIESKLF